MKMNRNRIQLFFKTRGFEHAPLGNLPRGVQDAPVLIHVQNFICFILKNIFLVPKCGITLYKCNTTVLLSNKTIIIKKGIE